MGTFYTRETRQAEKQQHRAHEQAIRQQLRDYAARQRAGERVIPAFHHSSWEAQILDGMREGMLYGDTSIDMPAHIIIGPHTSIYEGMRAGSQSYEMGIGVVGYDRHGSAAVQRVLWSTRRFDPNVRNKIHDMGAYVAVPASDEQVAATVEQVRAAMLKRS